MKKFNINFKNRETLVVVLGLVIVCVFTLTVAYSALSVVLTINGNAKVTGSNWKIYLSNPKVKSGSSTTNVPIIKTSSTLEFSTTLNMPGDFYEFTVDVVNGGSIDAMIENVVKNPELTVDQTKYLKYEISYQNGEDISTKQLLARNTTMPIRVRIEYRRDINNDDIPSQQVVLNLSFTLEYIQSDGNVNIVNNNGKIKKVNVVSGNGTQSGDEVCIENECFYVMYSDDETVTMISKYNLYVGGTYNHSNKSWTKYGSEATGKQDRNMLGYILTLIRKGTTNFASSYYWSSSSYPTYVYNENSILYSYIENYKDYLSTLGITPFEARLISYEELIYFGCSESKSSCGPGPEWIYATSYWSGSAKSYNELIMVEFDGYFSYMPYSNKSDLGCRPVIVISKDHI